MGKIPCLDCNEPFEVYSDKEVDDTVVCEACGSDFVIVATEPLEIEWSYEDYSDYEYDEDEWEEDDDQEDDDEWEKDELSTELWNQQFSKRKRVSLRDKELDAARRGQKQPRFQSN